MTITQVLHEVNPRAGWFTKSDDIGMGGLRAFDGRAFPLQSVKVRSRIAGPCAETIIEQRFANVFNEALDATWVFPLPSDGALVALELRAGEVRVVGECRKRQDALAEFEIARAEGKRAALVETEQKGVHTLSLAGLPPHTDIIVQLTVVELLPIVDSRFRWQFPTTIAPRYTPGLPVGHSGYGTTPDTDFVPNASRLTPPLRLSGGTTLDLEVEIAGALTSLESSLHAVKMNMDAGGIRIAPSTSATLDRDFILEFSVAESNAPVTRAYTDGRYTALVVEPPTTSRVSALPRDAVFAVDISGSMAGAKLDAAKKALIGALHGLNQGDRFKVLAFDDRVDLFRSDFAEYNDANVRAADKWIDHLDSRGGTEMLQPIQESLRGETRAGRVRTVLFITDGQSNDEARLLPAVANRRGNALFFTLGIDTAVNDALLKSLARAGGGVCELCTPGDDIDAVVAKLEARFGTPLLSDVRVAGAARPSGITVFSGRPASMMIEGSSDVVQLTADSPNGEVQQSITPEKVGFSLGPIWARERVSWLEERVTLRPFEEEAIKGEIERIALEHHIASKYTSFVCVDHSVQTPGARRHVVQPSELPAQWDEAAFGGGMPLAAPMPAFSQARSVKRSRTVLPFPMPPSASPQRPLPKAVSEEMEYPTDLIRGESSAQMPGSAASGSSSIGSLFSALGQVFSSSKESKKVRDNDAGAEKKAETFGSLLARSQSADGSFGGDIGRSAAALLVLLLLGSTRTSGNRRRVVSKLATWLEAHSSDARATLALNALTVFEATPGTSHALPGWESLTSEGDEGAMLAELLRSAS